MTLPSSGLEVARTAAAALVASFDTTKIPSINMSPSCFGVEFGVKFGWPSFYGEFIGVGNSHSRQRLTYVEYQCSIRLGIILASTDDASAWAQFR